MPYMVAILYLTIGFCSGAVFIYQNGGSSEEVVLCVLATVFWPLVISAYIFIKLYLIIEEFNQKHNIIYNLGSFLYHLPEMIYSLLKGKENASN